MQAVGVGGIFPPHMWLQLRERKEPRTQQAIVTACTLRDPTEQMLLKLSKFSVPEAGQGRRRNSHSSYVMYLFQAVNNEPEYILYTSVSAHDMGLNVKSTVWIFL